MAIDPNATVKDYKLLLYNKLEVDALIEAEKVRADAELAKKATIQAIGSPVGIARLNSSGTHEVSEIPFSLPSEASDVTNDTTIINPKRLHEEMSTYVAANVIPSVDLTDGSGGTPTNQVYKDILDAHGEGTILNWSTPVGDGTGSSSQQGVSLIISTINPTSGSVDTLLVSFKYDAANLTGLMTTDSMFASELLHASGSVEMDDGYSPTSSLDIATRLFVEQTSPTIFTGESDPLASTGKDGDWYYKTTVTGGSPDTEDVVTDEWRSTAPYVSDSEYINAYTGQLGMGPSASLPRPTYKTSIDIRLDAGVLKLSSEFSLPPHSGMKLILGSAEIPIAFKYKLGLENVYSFDELLPSNIAAIRGITTNTLMSIKSTIIGSGGGTVSVFGFTKLYGAWHEIQMSNNLYPSDPAMFSKVISSEVVTDAAIITSPTPRVIATSDTFDFYGGSRYIIRAVVPSVANSTATTFSLGINNQTYGETVVYSQTGAIVSTTEVITIFEPTADISVPVYLQVTSATTVTQSVTGNGTVYISIEEI